MPSSDIVIRGAREHNLRNVSLTLPRNKLIVMTGVSGSGKSSLAFDTLYAEGQRRYVESLSTYARQFLGQMPKPDVDSITGLAPSISIQQKSTSRNPRSTVGTITEIYDYLRVLFARVGQGYCHVSGKPIQAQSSDQIVQSILALPEGTKFQILAPIVQNQKGEFRDLFADLLKRGYLRARVDGEVVSLSDDLNLRKHHKHTIEVVIDRLTAGPSVRSRLAEAVEHALKLADGKLICSAAGSSSDLASGGRQTFGALHDESESRNSKTENPSRDRLYSANYSCPESGMSYEPPSPQLFSFNSPLGMCLNCNGLGMRHGFPLHRLVVDETKSITKGAMLFLPSLTKIGRWPRHIYQGAAEAIEADTGMKPGSLLKLAWIEIPEKAKQLWLFGTGERHVTFTWRTRGGAWKHGGKWDGWVNLLLEKFRLAKNPMLRRQLEKHMEVATCPTCDGERLNKQARHVRLKTSSERYALRIAGQCPPLAPRETSVNEGEKRGKRRSENRTDKTASDALSNKQKSNTENPLALELSLPQVCALSIEEACDFFASLELDPTGQLIAEEALKEIRGRLGFLMQCGLNYLTLERSAPTLSGGESQRIRLAGQIGCGLVGVVYILDEPSIGLHPRDNTMLLESLQRLRDQGNTVIVVEHDEETMRAADHVVDFGPGPGVRGGEVVVEGSVEDVLKNERSVTGQYLSGRQVIAIPKTRRAPEGRGEIVIHNAKHNNLKDVTVRLPLGRFICVTGVSGSGKSSLVNDILWQVVNRDLNKGTGDPGQHDSIEGLDLLDKAIDIDQSPIGRTPRSNPATYVKVFDEIRDLFTQLPHSQLRGYSAGRFSFNVEGGRCEACEGHGATKLEMDFLADIWVPCNVCEGRRFSHETLEVKFRDKSIADVLNMEVRDALTLFESFPKTSRLLQTLCDVGLDYMQLGQASPTLSGGEAQRIKLARELGKRSTGKTLYLLDEPTTGLHFADVHKLLEVLHNFVEEGNTVIVIEHNLDVIKTADWVIDVGPEGGNGGGYIIVEGTPETVAACRESHTGAALRPMMGMKSNQLLRGERQGVSPPSKPGNADDGRRDSITRKHRSSLNSAARDTEGLRPAARLSAMSPADPFFASDRIRIRGAGQHNLQNVSLEVPREQMSVFCGPSGSGKTSLAMDTLYAEGQRRYVESLSAYARQFLGQMPKPRVDSIQGLSPAIAIEQKTVGATPRSTVGTVTEIYDYLRVLYARLGTIHCPDCGVPAEKQTTDEIVEHLLKLGEGTRLLLLAPLDVDRSTAYAKVWDRLRAGGFVRVRIDGQTHSLDEVPDIDHRRSHDVEVVIDRVAIERRSRGRLTDSVEAALNIGKGTLRVAVADSKIDETKWQVLRFSLNLSCGKCQTSFEPQAPQKFSFNSPLGWCPACEGLGTEFGANQSLLISSPERSLRDGAVAAWPDPQQDTSFAMMLEAISQTFDLPLDVPWYRLTPQQQRLVMYGDEKTWIVVSSTEDRKLKTETPSSFRFLYRGIYPAIELASRMSYSHRKSLMEMGGQKDCSLCGGTRLKPLAAATQLRGITLPQLCRMPLAEALRFLKELRLSKEEKKIAGDLLNEATHRLMFLVEVGLDYLTMDRGMPTLSGGESQRIRLAGQIGRSLTGVLYVLDEPTIGLHPRDNGRLISALKRLRDLGNTVLLVEHDREVLEAADQLYDFGPGAGRLGGFITASGSPRDMMKSTSGSMTGEYLSGARGIPVPKTRRSQTVISSSSSLASGGRQPAAPEAESGKRKAGAKSETNTDLKSQIPHLKSSTASSENRKPKTENPPVTPARLELLGASLNNLRNVDLRIPLGTLTCVTGVSGSGKSSLVMDTLARAVARKLNLSTDAPGPFRELLGIEHLSKIVIVDQNPIGNTPASNPATYTGVFDEIRSLFTRMPEARVRGYKDGRFSFNRAGGRCEDCEGMGQKKIEMHFLPDVWVECPTCRGKRFNAETLLVKFNECSIADVLEMPINRALEVFQNVPKIRAPLATLEAIGLGYLTLGQSAPTLSGGEAQRIKLAAELAKPNRGRTLYLLDEPTTGLHFDDIAKLLAVLNSLVEQGNTVVVIEHNLDVIKTADWVIDIGPEAGGGGGRIVVEGTPEDIVAYAIEARNTAESGQSEIKPVSRKRKAGANVEDANSDRRSPTEHRNPKAENQPPAASRSWTGELLAPVLAQSTVADVKTFDVASVAAVKSTDVTIAELGNSAKLPWEADGRRWHCVDRLSHNGAACQWDGKALEFVVDLLAKKKQLTEVNWNHRSTVEIKGRAALGWFLHARTAGDWLLSLCFRVRKNAFTTEDLDAALGLKPLDDIEEIPVYGREPRVKARNLKTAWQEVTVKVWKKAEIDTPAFRRFLDQAVDAFTQQATKEAANPEDLMPWKQLGRKWHLMRKGLPANGKVAWDFAALEALLPIVESCLPGCTADYGIRSKINWTRDSDGLPIAELHTKRSEDIELVVFVPRDSITIGAIASLGSSQEITAVKSSSKTSGPRDAVAVRFQTKEQVVAKGLRAFLQTDRIT